MDFVDEDDGAGAILPRFLSVRHHLLDFLDTGEHGREFDEVRAGHISDDVSESGLADTRRSPEDYGTCVIAFDLHTERFPWRENVLLSDEFVERSRAHAITERTGFAHGARGRGRWGRESPHV